MTMFMTDWDEQTENDFLEWFGLSKQDIQEYKDHFARSELGMIE